MKAGWAWSYLVFGGVPDHHMFGPFDQHVRVIVGKHENTILLSVVSLEVPT